MSGRKLAVNVVVETQPGTGAGFEVLLAGQEVPDWALPQLGDHVFEADDDSGDDAEQPRPVKKTAAKKAPAKKAAPKAAAKPEPTSDGDDESADSDTK